MYGFRNGQWSLVMEVMVSDGSVGDRFGASLSLFGGTLVVGAPLNTGSNSDNNIYLKFE